MDDQPYSALPGAAAAPAAAPAPRRGAGLALGLALALACGAGGYRLGRRSAPQAAPPITAAAPTAAPAVAATPAAPEPATREYIQVDLEPAQTPPLAPLGKEAFDQAVRDVIVFKRSVVHVGRHRTPPVSGRPFDVTVDGKPYHSFMLVSPANPYTEDMIIAVKGRETPHSVDWGGSVTSWDGQKMTWSPKTR